MPFRIIETPVTFEGSHNSDQRRQHLVLSSRQQMQTLPDSSLRTAQSAVCQLLR